MNSSGLFFSLSFLAATLTASSQVALGPSITNSSLPADTTQISAFTPYIDSTGVFANPGFHYWDLVPDFTLFDTSSIPHKLSTILSDGKPVLLISGSYTCPRVRTCFENTLPTIYNSFNQQVNIFVVYTLEAHPLGPDYSPYWDTVWVPQQDSTDGVLYHQPQNYEQRKMMVDRLTQHIPIPVPVLLDSPRNEWWSAYGPAPNIGYLLTPQGRVYRRYNWSDVAPDNIGHDIGLLLMNTGVANAQQNFSAQIYPNPSTGPAQLQVNGTNSFSLFISDATGRLVGIKSNATASIVDLSQFDLAPGVYYLRIEAEGPNIVVLPFVQN